MSNLKLRIKNTANQKVSPSATLVVNGYTWDCIGGPLKGSISARGTQEDVMQLAGYLRYPIEILSAENDEPYWWGMVYGIEMRFGQSVMNVSLGGMYNKLRMTFRDNLAGTGSQKTAWAQHAESAAYYGMKEKIYSGSDMSIDEADQRRDVVLDMMKFPQAVNKTGHSEGGSYSALLTLKGWFNALSWEYYTQAAGLEQLIVSGDGVQHMGNASNYRVAQSFVTSNTRSWNAANAGLKIRKFGTPTDNFLIDICSDSSGEPGTILSTATIAGSTVSEAYRWTYEDFASSPLLSKNTKYWVVAKRSGGQDGTNYYSVDVTNGDERTDGICRMYNGASWSDRSPEADMPFKVKGKILTSDQIGDMATYAQFITGSDIELPTTIYGNPYRDGNADLQFYLREILRTGTQNGLRYLCKVDRDRVLHVWEEPSISLGPSLVANTNGIWRDRRNTVIPPAQCPVGVWYKQQETPKLPGLEYINDPGIYFIETATYNARKDTIETEPRLSTGVFDVIQIT